MYRIELAPNEETVFRTIEELAIGVRNGVVTQRARIYHSASGKWLPIEFHPHYRQALGLPPTRTGMGATRAPERAATLSFAVPRPTPSEAPIARPDADASMLEGLAVIEGTATAEDAIALEDTEAETEEEAAAEYGFALEPVDALPPVVDSPVLRLPTISYPAITPLEPPVAMGVAGAPRSRLALLRLVGAAGALALVGYGMMFVFRPSGGGLPDQSDVVAPPASTPAQAAAPPPPVAPPPVAPPPAAARATPTPPPLVLTQPASSGFAPALEPRAIVSSSSAASSPVVGRIPAPTVNDSSIAPAPGVVDLTVPDLAGVDSLAPSHRQPSDSAMQRLLRSLNGGKEVPGRQ